MRNFGLAHSKKCRGINRFALYRASQAARSKNAQIVILRTELFAVAQASRLEYGTNTLGRSLAGILG